MKTGISVAINTKNEEKNIKDCILSAKNLADEIIVVDMESEDKTVNIAKGLGAKAFSIKDYGYVEPARNFALSKCSGEWILVLDADERLTKKLSEKIQKEIKRKDAEVFKIPRKNILLDKWIKHALWWPDYQVRLFKNGKVKWPETIHTQPVFDGVAKEFDPKEENAIVHFNINTVDDLLRMIDRYSDHEKRWTKEQITPEGIAIGALKEFEWRYIEHEGYKEGIHGFVLSKFMEFYRLLEFAKFWEKEGYPENINAEKLKEAVLSELRGGSNNSKEVEERKELESFKGSRVYKAWKVYQKTKKSFK